MMLALASLRFIIVAAGLAGLAGSAWAETYVLVKDLGVQGIYRRCKYSNGKVYGLPPTEPACYERIEVRPKAAAPRAPTPPLTAAGSAPYRNCAAARAAGAAPVRRGDPGYAPWLDRDSDGVGCEPPP